MKSNSALNEITIPNNFIKSTIKSTSKDEVLQKLNDFSERFSYCKDMTIYYFIKQCLSQKMYFKFNREIIDEIYYLAAIWASKEETIQKTRPKSFNDVKKKKNQLVFTKLYIDTIKFLDSEFKENSLEKYLELEVYISLLNNLSCIKRTSFKQT